MSDRTLGLALDFLDGLLAERPEDGHFLTVFRRAIENLGFETFTYAAVRTVPGTVAAGAPTVIGRPYCISMWEGRWTEHYQRSRYYEIDPVFQASLRSLLPLDWRHLRPADRSAPAHQVMRDAHAIGFKQGITIPVHAPDGEFGLISVTADVSDREFAKLAAAQGPLLHLLAIHFHEAARRHLQALQRAGTVGLSAREVQALIWAGHGKTNEEIADILHLSSRTVRFHLRNAATKLGVETRIQAVVRAVQLGLISL
ncbi:MAG TPA: LuxR family transcriptional regulator [Alphaproteobacteria bacterium]|nr:LuxR family transcriptional regulator [Alphaproteobacteria bacterium]